jgi:asparagine synthase (glutamine-hydrolysing)
MCGISGVVDFTQAAGLPNGGLDVLNHRGPDAAGCFASGAGWVGQNRLAIIDLHSGDPPITNEDGTVGVAANGEIYNFVDLRRQLSARGHRFATTCDSEVIAHLAEQCSSAELAQKLEGMFAIAVWDDQHQRLMLIRDRLGKKPLYYWSDGRRLVFGSEIKAVLRDQRVPRRLNPRAIPAYLTFGYVPSPETFFDGIVSVPPGCALTFEEGSAPRLETYWTPPRPGIDAEHAQGSHHEIAGEVRFLLREAVRRRLVADVPLGAFLSGGIDSSAVVGLMSELSDGPVKTFTIGFDDRDGFDERPFARQVAHRFGAEHHEFVVQPHAVDLVERLVWHHDQPFGDSSAIPMFLLSEVTRQEVTVALSGDGGDELFAGYERFAAALLTSRYQRLPKPIRRLGEVGVDFLPSDGLRGRIGSVQRFVRRADLPLPESYLGWLSYVEDTRRRRLVREDQQWARQLYREQWDETKGAIELDRLLNLNLRTYLVDDLLVKVDRMSMAHALEVRSPFLDRELVEFALRIPGRLKVRGPSLKWILKQAVADLLPPDLLRRRKRGFGVPVARWFREDLTQYVDGTIGSPTARIRQHLVSREVDALLAEHRLGVRDHGHALWALLTLEIFLRREDW